MVEYPQTDLDDIYAAISHPARRQVLERLKPGDATVTELAGQFTMSLAAVSKHIRVLEAAGLVRRTVQGREHHLSLEPSPLITASGWLETYRSFWDERLDFLEAKLKRHTR
ncbi:MAG TPA: metalloregulator ArsR/SmtB family transcription factor [Candidatus Dormibacteraeota bacterium]|jgi:DNA-binding transcriptional ArsR family regulator|nr:metalloregulator ArsR/SmtB family transcription factor [Candidatus Dormibacteraeota bacterium]